MIPPPAAAGETCGSSSMAERRTEPSGGCGFKSRLSPCRPGGEISLFGGPERREVPGEDGCGILLRGAHMPRASAGAALWHNIHNPQKGCETMADEEKTLPGYFAVLPANVRYDPRLSAAEKLMFAEISALAQRDGSCWAKTSYFCKLYGVADSTVRKWIANLQKTGYIRTELVTKKGMVTGRRIFLISQLPTPAEKSADKNNINNNNNTPLPPTGGSDATNEAEHLFRTFWREYPSKKDKKKAERAWKKIKGVEKQFPAIMRALLIQKQSPQWTKDGGQYIPLPSTWLNGERWKDDTTPAAVPAEPRPPQREVHRRL